MKKNIIHKKISGFANNWVVIAALLIIVMLGGIIYYNYYFKKSIPGVSINQKSAAPINPEINDKIKQEEQTQESTPMVILSLSSDKKEYNVNDLINVDVLLSLADKKTPGVDVLVKYEPKFLELQKTAGGGLQINGVVSDPKQILKTSKSSFDTFPYLKANILDGSIFFSALAQPKKDVIGEVNIASIVFKAVKKGNTKVSLIFDKSLNQDTGVFYMGKDILDKVIDFEIVVK